mgnify:CR=1 FL=1
MNIAVFGNQFSPKTGSLVYSYVKQKTQNRYNYMCNLLNSVVYGEV